MLNTVRDNTDTVKRLCNANTVAFKPTLALASMLTCFVDASMLAFFTVEQPVDQGAN